jgi:hypothetical protein
VGQNGRKSPLLIASRPAKQGARKIPLRRPMQRDPLLGIQWALTALLESPKFLYRTELGAPSVERADANAPRSSGESYH